MTRSRRQYVMASAVLFVILGACYVALFASEGWRFKRLYDRVELGMTLNELEQVFGRAPDYTCRFDCFTVVYFCRDRWVLENQRLPGEVDYHGTIPNIYGAAQILVGPDGRVQAYTWNGEETQIHTPDGRVPGSVLGTLPAEFFRCD